MKPVSGHELRTLLRTVPPFCAALLAVSAWAAAGAGPDLWGFEDFDPVEYFTAAELTEWKALANRYRLLSLIALPVTLGFNALFSLTPFALRLRDRTRRLGDRLAERALFRTRPARNVGGALRRLFGDDWSGALLFTYAYLLAGVVVLLPLTLGREWLSQTAGLSNYTAGGLVWDMVKGQAMTTLSYTFVVVGLFGLIRRMPRRWWIVLGIPAGGFLIAYGLIAPYKQRAFYDFQPLSDPALRQRLERLAEREGLSFENIKVIDASRTTSTLNAYITGVGPSRELVLYDTLLEALAPEEIEVAVAHELGHQRNRNTTLRYVLSGLGLVALMWLASLLLLRAPRWFGFDGPGDVRGLPLLVLFMSLLFLSIRPAEKAYSRYQERLADQVSLSITAAPEAFVSLQVKLARRNKADVVRAPWVDLWFAGHPSIYERIGTARWYRGWLAGAAKVTPPAPAPR